MVKKVSERRKRKQKRDMLKLVQGEDYVPTTPQEINAQYAKNNPDFRRIWEPVEEPLDDENGRIGGSRKKGGKQRYNVPRSLG